MPDEIKSVQNDWHSIFCTTLNIKLYEFRDRVRIESEAVLGVEPPRADFIIVTEDEIIDFKLDVFRIFRRVNVIEYKGSGDRLDERVLCKAVGYALLYIGISDPRDVLQAQDVTVSIFREAKPRKLFKEYSDRILPDEARGIYHIDGFSMPVQIVVMSELEGDDNALFRAISRDSELDDIRGILKDAERTDDVFLLEQFGAYLNKIRRAGNMWLEKIVQDDEMADDWMEVFKDRIDARISLRIKESFFECVSDGGMTREYAAAKCGIPLEAFMKQMNEYLESKQNDLQPV